MIVCRRPFMLYDVDVIGVAALLVIGLAACVGVITPASANAAKYRDLSVEIAAANTQLRQSSQHLSTLNAAIIALQDEVTEHRRDVPKRGALTPFLQSAASLAERCNLQILQVVPQPVRRADGRLVGDVRFSGCGTALDLLRWLDRLARENPYYALQDYSITRPDTAGDARCQLGWTLRLYMLDSESSPELTEERP